MRDGQTSPHRPRLDVSRSTCPPLSPTPPREQLYNRYCSNEHTLELDSEALGVDREKERERETVTSDVPSTVGRLGVDGFWVGDYGGGFRVGRPVGAR